MKTVRKIEISIAVSVLILIFAGIAGFAHTCNEVRQNVLRLHVVAASDSDEDQSLKLKVRDAVLKEGSDIFDGSVNVQNRLCLRLSESKQTPLLIFQFFLLFSKQFPLAL